EKGETDAQYRLPDLRQECEAERVPQCLAENLVAHAVLVVAGAGEAALSARYCAVKDRDVRGQREGERDQDRPLEGSRTQEPVTTQRLRGGPAPTTASGQQCLRWDRASSRSHVRNG